MDDPAPPRRVSTRGRLRLDEAGRELAINMLKRAAGTGQLSLDEFDDRVALVYGATIRDELRPAIQDLAEYQAVRADPRLMRYWLD